MNPLAAGTVFEDLLRQVDSLLPQDEAGAPIAGREYSDVVADFLGFLAERMTELHQERQAERQAFFSWLEARLGCSIDELAGNTTLLSYDELENVDRLLAVIERNHPSKTSLDVSAPEAYRATNRDRELIASGYDKSMQRLRPILTQIELTDRLVDLVVYRLYGLTREEIGLVENTAR